MKHILNLIAITIFFSTQIHAQTWTSHNAGTVDLITNISFPTNDTGYVIDEFGLIKKTVNGATSWTAVPSPATIVSSIVFVSTQIGFSIGDSLIYKTTNGGITWTQVMNDNEVILTNIFFADVSTGYACSMKYVGDSVRLYKTTNGGNNWTKIGTKEFIISESGLYFMNTTKGFWSTNANIFSTTDGGASFNSVYNDLTQSQYFINLTFPNADTGYAVDYVTLLRSDNGGASWSSINVPGLLMYDTYFSTGKKGFACGGNGFSTGWVSQTSDAGVTWTSSYTSSYTYVCMDFPSDTIGYVGGFNGSVLRYAGTLTGIAANQNQPSLNIYPNPAIGIVNITNAIPGSKISLLNLSGQIITEERVEHSSLQINLDNIAAGIYFIEMDNIGEKTVQKLIVY